VIRLTLNIVAPIFFSTKSLYEASRGLILRRDLARSPVGGSAARQEAGSEQANHGAFSRYFWEVMASRISDPTFWPGAHDRSD
jgi:hypothetical protein